jgi:hypothetical protein
MRTVPAVAQTNNARKYVYSYIIKQSSQAQFVGRKMNYLNVGLRKQIKPWKLVNNHTACFYTQAL